MPVPHLPHLPGLSILVPGTLGSCAFRNERWVSSFPMWPHVCTHVATFLERRVAPGGSAQCPSDLTGERRPAPRVLYRLAPRRTHWPRDVHFLPLCSFIFRNQTALFCTLYYIYPPVSSLERSPQWARK